MEHGYCARNNPDIIQSHKRRTNHWLIIWECHMYLSVVRITELLDNIMHSPQSIRPSVSGYLRISPTFCSYISSTRNNSSTCSISWPYSSSMRVSSRIQLQNFDVPACDQSLLIVERCPLYHLYKTLSGSVSSLPVPLGRRCILWGPRRRGNGYLA